MIRVLLLYNSQGHPSSLSRKPTRRKGDVSGHSSISSQVSAMPGRRTPAIMHELDQGNEALQQLRSGEFAPSPETGDDVFL